MEEIITEGMEMDASDIHFIPGERCARMLMRKKGELECYGDLENHHYQILLQKAKAMAQMNISEKRMPQDGILKVNGLSIRVSTLRSLKGESLVLRLFTRELIALEKLGLRPEISESLISHVRSQMGIHLISGETGMGKSTTMYALMMKLRDLNQKIISIEDPVEREVDGIIQSQINGVSGFDYEKAIFAALRQDPDYICIGEIRNKETASALIRAALTGHKVISTIHAKRYDSVRQRMTDFGISREYMDLTLSLVMNQRLRNTEGGKVVDATLDISEDFG
ncbi:Flp pilus assembly complex ATPase component TadA [Proteiniclasticum sp. SCR006]|uniref:Flp pilus assembly complex ATPase component TadA n=1 Tax=Proteiniclasticum aestuarii TaxID=2817862 RepID=A0A939KEL5_9CLOT|nr:ATPase, T2SS/T4P/T4SS family [Proteiniclasticum aestuarii]MBO1263547.1 Flp pilus assembly complex ATPase component TadA [Proteiniclasticum aestuarii]